MHYLEDPNRMLWPSVARSIAALEPFDMVLCLYPGQTDDEFEDPFGAADTFEWFERINEYDDDAPPCSRRIAVDEELLGYLEAHADDLEEWGESLALYRPRQRELVAACIPHEGVIVVDDQFASTLAADGFRLSNEPPEWWNPDS